MADEKKKKHWWDDAESAEEDTATIQPKEEEFISQTPPTIKSPKSAAETEPTIVGGQGFSPTPPTMKLPGGPVPVAPTQQYAPFATTQQGFATTPTTPQTIPGYPQAGYPLPIMPGTMPGAVPPTTPEEIAHFQQLQLAELGAGIPYATQGGKFDLILDVSVPLTVVLGQAKLRIHEVLGLQPGSVIPLDRNAEEAVDLFIKDKLIAHGEVVVVDGNFGIKITKIVEPIQGVKDLG